jgi:hypothetical protein
MVKKIVNYLQETYDGLANVKSPYLSYRTEENEEKRKSVKLMLLPRSASRTSTIHVYTLLVLLTPKKELES